MARELWRKRCPKGHASWRVRRPAPGTPRDAVGVECQCCDEEYEYLVDAKTGRKLYP